MPHDRLLDVKDLNIHYTIEGDQVPVADKVSIFIDPGEIAALVGESGSGKTQIALALAGLLPKTANVNFISDGLPKTAMIFQDPLNALNPVIKIGKQIGEGLIKHTIDKKKKVMELLDNVGIDNPEKRYSQYPHEFSGGMRQRTLIAMALAQEPELLIADEPTTALDVTTQTQIIELLKGLNDQKGLSILFISHDLSLVKSFADRVMVIYAGRIVESAPAKIIFSDPKHPYTKALIQVAGMAKENNYFITIDGSIPDPQNYPSGCRFHPRCNRADEVCSREYPDRIHGDNHIWDCIHI